MKFRRLRHTFAILFGATVAPMLLAGEVQVAVAANFVVPLRELSEAFSRQSGHTLRISAGATGKLYAQIVHGAPFEVFLSADSATPERLEKEGRVVAGSRHFERPLGAFLALDIGEIGQIGSA